MPLKSLAASIAALGLALVATASQATDLITNGSFETTTNGNGQLGFNTDVTGWSVPGGTYTFVFAPGTADTTGADGQYGNLQLWGPGNGSANGLTSSPDGGNFVAADGAFNTGPLTQTISGLTVGKQYVVKFDFAGAQQNGFTGATTEQFLVSLGGDTQATQVLHDASHGFTGWKQTGMVFTATSTSEVLSFLAVGTPTGVPPFSLLDGVSMNAVPEPATWAMMILGVGGIGAGARMRRRATATAAA